MPPKKNHKAAIEKAQEKVSITHGRLLKLIDPKRRWLSTDEQTKAEEYLADLFDRLNTFHDAVADEKNA